MDHLKTKRMKDEIRELLRLTRPPRLEGVVKETAMQPVRKQKSAHARVKAQQKKQGYTSQERKDYQLGNKYHG